MKPCDECMKDAPYSWCCRMECGEHEFCKNCEAEARKQPGKDCRLKKPIWIVDGHHIRCGMCGIYMCDTDREGDAIPRNFCPNCGEKMTEEEKDDG